MSVELFDAEGVHFCTVTSRLSQTHNKQISVLLWKFSLQTFPGCLFRWKYSSTFGVHVDHLMPMAHRGKRWNLSWFFPRKAGIQLQHSNVDGTSWSNVTNALIKIRLHRWWQLKDFWMFYPYILGEMIKFDDHIVLRWVVQPPTSRFFLCRLFCRLSMESVLVHWNPLKAPFDFLNKNTVTSHKFHGYSAYVDETLNQKGDLCRT